MSSEGDNLIIHHLKRLITADWMGHQPNNNNIVRTDCLRMLPAKEERDYVIHAEEDNDDDYPTAVKFGTKRL